MTALRRIGWLPLTAIVIALAAGLWFGARWYNHDRFRVTTDDAYIDTQQVMAMSRVSERVAEVLVDANQPVHRGQLLVRLDDVNERAKVDMAERNLSALRAAAVAAERAADLEGELQSAQVHTERGNVEAARLGADVAASQATASKTAIDVARSQVDAALAAQRVADAALPAAQRSMESAQRDRDRNHALAEQGYVSSQAVDASESAYAQARSAYDAAVASSASARVNVRTAQAQLAQISGTSTSEQRRAGALRAQIPVAQGKLQEMAAPSRVLDKRALADEAAANVAAGESQLRLAQIDLDATRIVAPVDGFVASRDVERGQTVAPGQALMTIAPAKRVFVTANYKETQMPRVRVGAPVEISVDACGGKTFSGRVVAIGPVAQSALSTLPTLTAPSNFVKVAQRIPVRISLPADSDGCTFRPGMSVETSVVTR